ncbi:UDP-N-acetylglucosamine 2-epimerase [Rhizobium leguminosarum]|uniref:UDP-N-acetylglucosamine 2-epimerase n=1 Tax=Rhizobium leguminosarum TaxID=384 RepID=UPI0013EF2166|nr:UDP-N-acetylglucosamine 2-epimerase [Rhizobium leguminosarum]
MNLSYFVTGQQSNVINRLLSVDQADFLNRHVIAASGTFSYSITANLISNLVKENGYNAVLSIGDTKTSLCAAIGAKFAGVPLIHYESGLRGAELTIEERIRRKIDRMSSYHLCYNIEAAENLISEGISPLLIKVVGSLYEESLGRSLAAHSNYDHRYDDVLIVSLHRKENHLNSATAKAIAEAISSSQDNIVFIRHPSNNDGMVSVLSKSPYFWKIENEFSASDFAHLLMSARAVITDSAGIAEQSSLLSKPTVLLRSSTERPWLLGPTTKSTSVERLAETMLSVMGSPAGYSKLRLNTNVSANILAAIGMFLRV